MKKYNSIYSKPFYKMTSIRSCFKKVIYIIISQFFWIFFVFLLFMLFVIVQFGLKRKFQVLLFILIPITILLFLIYVLVIIAIYLDVYKGKIFLLIIFILMFCFLTSSAVILLAFKESKIKAIEEIFRNPKYEVVRRTIELISNCCPYAKCVVEFCLHRLLKGNALLIIGIIFASASGVCLVGITTLIIEIFK